MTKAMPFLQKAILLSYDPRRFAGGYLFSSKVLTPILTLYVFVNHEWSRRDLAALSVFGGDEAIFALSAPFFLQRLVYNDHTAFEGNAKQTARGR